MYKLPLFFRHADEMIKKLETAGLGYYVKADSTQHKFGMKTYVLTKFSNHTYL